MAFLALPTLHGALLREIREGIPTVIHVQQTARSKSMDRLCLHVATLASELSYLVVLPLVLWNVDAALGRQLLVLWGLGFYVCNYLRDLLMLPRPPRVSSVVREVERRAAGDFALPSVRVFSATVVSAYVLLVAQQDGWARPVGVAVGAVWVAVVAFSRLYLGANSPACVMAGVFLGGLFASAWLLVGAGVDALLTDPASWLPLAQPLLSLLLLMAYPAPLHAVPSYPSTAAVLGFVAGAVTGSAWFLRDSRALLPPEPAALALPDGWLVLARSALGLGLCWAARALALRLLVGRVPPGHWPAPRLGLNKAAVIRAHPAVPDSSSCASPSPELLLAGGDGASAPSGAGSPHARGRAGSGHSEPRPASEVPGSDEVPALFAAHVVTGICATHVAPVLMRLLSWA